MPRTPDTRPGPLYENEEIVLEANAVGPTVGGAFNYNGSVFQMRDAAGTFDPRTGAAPTEPSFLRHFLLMGG